MPPLACISSLRPQLMPMELEARARKGRSRPVALGGSRRQTATLESPQSLPESPNATSTPNVCYQPSVDGVQWEEDKPIVRGVPVRAAALPTLAALCVYAFDFVGGLHDLLSGFPRVLFLMHSWFCTSHDLLHALVHLEEQALRLSPCHRATCTHSFKNISECPAFQLRAQVCRAIRYWLLEFPIHFALDSELSSDVRNFQRRLQIEQQEDLAVLVEVSQAPPCEWVTRHSSQRKGKGKHTPTTSRSADDNDNKQHSAAKVPEDSGSFALVRKLRSRELAAHLTFLEHRVMRRITFTDLKTYIQSGTVPPHLECSITFFNGLSQWIQCSVLECSTPQSRAEIVAKFVHVAKHLRDLQNFNSLMAVVGSLSHSALARLTKTMSCIPQDCQKTLADLSDLLSSSSNFSSYRRALQTSEGFKIPVLGVHLKDLVSLHVALPDTVEGGLVNFRKVTQLSLIFQELQEVQKASPELHPDRDTLQALRESLDLSHSEDQIYELSLAREPKLTQTVAGAVLTSPSSSLSMESSVPMAPPLLPSPSDGALMSSTVPSPEQQLTTMVEALFRQYDTNRDGFICKKEFAAITSCLPGFLQANFEVVDVNQDGLISQSELKKYLSQQSGISGLLLPCHSFQETTYFKPTFCVHCAGLLWGLIKQGYKCRDCGVNAHKHCKDLVIFECRGRSLSMSEASSTSSSSLTSRRRFRRRKKLSHSESESSPPSPPHISPQERAASYDSPISVTPTSSVSTPGPAPVSPKAQQRRSSFSSRSSSLSAPPSPKPPLHLKTPALSSATLVQSNPMRRTRDELLLPPPRRKISDSLALPFLSGGSSLVSPLLERRRKSSGAPSSNTSSVVNKENGNLLNRQQNLCHQMASVLSMGTEGQAAPSTPCPWLDEVQ